MRTPPQFIVTSLFLYLLATRQKYTLFALNKTFICSHFSLFGLRAVFQKVREAKIFRSFYRAWIICFLNSIFFAKTNTSTGLTYTVQTTDRGKIGYVYPYSDL